MATSSGPNLEFARVAVERLMDDSCTISVPGDPADAVMLDDLTLDEYTNSLIYTGPCMVSPDLRQESSGEGGGEPITVGRFRGAIPINSDPGVPVGAILTVTSARRDQSLVGLKFRITEIEPGTFKVARKFRLELRDIDTAVTP